MATTIGESISRLRNMIKAVREDAFITDRLLYSVMIKYAKLYIKRQDHENKIMKFQSLFEPIPCEELIEVDKVEACCSGIKTGCTIRRTKNRLPEIFEGAYGPLFRDVSSIDRSINLYKTNPSTYTAITNSTNYKYNKNKYYWYLDGYLYFPDIPWDGVLIEALWAEPIDHLKCDDVDPCKPIQEHILHIPEYLFPEIEQSAFKELSALLQITPDLQDNKQNLAR